MDVTSLTLAYFSPTRTTQQVVDGIAAGIHAKSVTRIDLTPPSAEEQSVRIIRGDVAILGAPVYGGRIPVPAVSRLQKLKAANTLAVIVVVYGNRAYEDALLELRDLTVARGFKPVVGGAFIGEHSFHTDETPIAPRRPDEQDLITAWALGARIRAALEEYIDPRDIPPLQVPGTFPYKELGHSLDGISPTTSEDHCTLCGACVETCPTAALTMNTRVMTNSEVCIRCCACVKRCPTNARIMTHPRIKKIADWLSTDYQKRREPEIFLASE